MKDPSCLGSLSIECSNDIPYLSWKFVVLQLENISYNTNTIRAQDLYLHSSLKNSGCGNLYFNFSSDPVKVTNEMYNLINSSLYSVRCDQYPNQIESPPKIFGKDYKLSYSPSTLDEDHKSQQNCSRPHSSLAPSFEYIFSFKNDSDPELSLLSASYSDDFVAQPGCFANSIEVKGCVVGFTFVLAFGCLLLFFYKCKKPRFSSSSKLLVQREVSDQYFHDPEMVRSEYTQIFSYEELREATEGFSESKEVGDGGFGIVYKGILKDGRTVAVKRLYKNSYKSTKQFMNEVEILSGLHHPNLVTLYGSTASSSRELLLVYEFVPNGTVADHLHGPHSSENALTWPVRLSIAIETANALSYLHAVEPPIIHRDVKTRNILLDDGFHVKVGDFGLSRLFPLDVTHVSTVPQGTPGYVDPVYHQCYHLTDKSDVYSFGVVLMELISSKQAVDMSRSKDEINLANMALNKIQSCQLDDLMDPALGFSSNWEVRCMISSVAELAFRCLQPDREMRPSIKEVLEMLRVIEKGDYNGDKMVKENMIQEETYLLKCEANISSDSLKSSSMTTNTSG
ncbi:putative serine/threonine-protein kinase [Carex littledalei]|uniref:Putative serine/threonine-protein kinase n=1 Tax=Carex littledalei TaxID=544730 RepID=A0A833RJ34_9POAL|nr:putative serine/threonine-protein kinase [Carex littledalei]